MTRSFAFAFALQLFTALALADDEVRTLKYGDGVPDGKQSLGGSGELIEFSLPRATSKVSGLRIHGSRYGLPEAPEESFLIYFLTGDRQRIVAAEMAPYSLFERGSAADISATASLSVTTPAPKENIRASGCREPRPLKPNLAVIG